VRKIFVLPSAEVAKKKIVTHPCMEKKNSMSGMSHADKKTEMPAYVVPSETRLRELRARLVERETSSCFTTSRASGDAKRKVVEVDVDGDLFRPAHKEESDDGEEEDGSDKADETFLLCDDTEIRIADYRARRAFGQHRNPDETSSDACRLALDTVVRVTSETLQTLREKGVADTTFAPPPYYSTFHYPGVPVDAPKCATVPDVATFAAQLDAITCGVSGHLFRTRLPLFAAGGAVLMALHEFERIETPRDLLRTASAMQRGAIGTFANMWIQKSQTNGGADSRVHTADYVKRHLDVASDVIELMRSLEHTSKSPPPPSSPSSSSKPSTRSELHKKTSSSSASSSTSPPSFSTSFDAKTPLILNPIATATVGTATIPDTGEYELRVVEYLSWLHQRTWETCEKGQLRMKAATKKKDAAICSRCHVAPFVPSETACVAPLCPTSPKVASDLGSTIPGAVPRDSWSTVPRDSWSTVPRDSWSDHVAKTPTAVLRDSRVQFFSNTSSSSSSSASASSSIFASVPFGSTKIVQPLSAFYLGAPPPSFSSTAFPFPPPPPTFSFDSASAARLWPSGSANQLVQSGATTSSFSDTRSSPISTSTSNSLGTPCVSFPFSSSCFSSSSTPSFVSSSSTPNYATASSSSSTASTSTDARSESKETNPSRRTTSSNCKCKQHISGAERIRRSFRSTDLDLFLVTSSADEAVAAIVEVDLLIRGCVPVEHIRVARTDEAVTWYLPRPFCNVQIVLRLYESREQVLLGFDLCACAVGYDGQEIVAARRAWRALETRMNLVDETRQSTTLESRLVKYAERGFAIAVPRRISHAHVKRFVAHIETLDRYHATRQSVRDKQSSARVRQLHKETPATIPLNYFGAGLATVMYRLIAANRGLDRRRSLMEHEPQQGRRNHSRRSARAEVSAIEPCDYGLAQNMRLDSYLRRCHLHHQPITCAFAFDIARVLLSGDCLLGNEPTAVLRVPSSVSPIIRFQHAQPMRQSRSDTLSLWSTPSTTFESHSESDPPLFSGSFNPITGDWYQTFLEPRHAATQGDASFSNVKYRV
jgi:hypothetical protein